jgi:glycosyltransferase involved in cell wall biosynthesis
VRQARVGVSAALERANPTTGHGRLWSSTLAELRKLVELVPVPPEPAPGRDSQAGGANVDVWLVNGHGGEARVDAPAVAMVHEVGWTRDQLSGREDSGPTQPLASLTAAGVASAARVIVPSEASRRQVVERCGVPPERVHTVPEGVDPAVFHPGAAGGRSLVARHAGEHERPYVLFVGTLHPRKNFFALREAVAALARRGYPHVLAIVAGEVDERFPSAPRDAAGAELPNAPGRVVMIPDPDDQQLAALMAGADAFCLPSLAEGFGLPALEAMACGTVVVVSDRGALPEVVGDAGLVIQPTAVAIEEALRGVFDQPGPSAALRKRAVSRARQFGWNRTARGWAQVLERAAGEPASRRLGA